MMKKSKDKEVALGGLLLLSFLLIMNGLPAIFAYKGKMHDDRTKISFSRIVDLSAFHKMTLGLPVSINRESAEGLTAIPGIGPKTAGFIIHERVERGGFQRLEDLKSIKGIGAKQFEKMKSFLEL